MELWALILILATIVLSALGSALAVGMFVRSQDRGCSSRYARLTSSTSCIVPVVYPSMQIAGVTVREDAFPLHAPYVVYKPHLDAAALTADIKANFAAFEPMLTYLQLTASRCYLLDATSPEARGDAPRGLMTSALMQVVDAASVPRLLLLSSPAPSAAGGSSDTLAVYTTNEATDPATYTGTWTWKSTSAHDGPSGTAAVAWWVPSPKPACVVPVLYAAVILEGDAEYQFNVPKNAPFLPYKPYLDAAGLTADLKSNFPYFEAMLTSSKWTASRCYMLDTSSPEARRMSVDDGTYSPTTVILQVTEAGFGDRLVIMSRSTTAAALGLMIPDLVLYTTTATTDPASYSGTWTWRTNTRGDGPPGEVSVAWGKAY
jgi:hypothetical protein